VQAVRAHDDFRAGLADHHALDQQAYDPLLLATKALNARAASGNRRDYDPNNTKYCFRVLPRRCTRFSIWDRFPA